MKWFRLLLAVFLMLAIVLFGSPATHADEPVAGESRVVIDICVTGATQVQVTASDGSRIDVGTQGTADAHMDFTAATDTVMDIYITGKGEADIDVSGRCELNIKVEGPSEVHIDAGDEVELHVEASDESQVFIDDEKANDEPGDKSINVEASDPHQAMVSDQNVNDAPGDDHSSRLNSLAIISGAFLGAGLLAFFLVRRKAKRG